MTLPKPAPQDRTRALVPATAAILALGAILGLPAVALGLTCPDPQMTRFPVQAPHNIGYDGASCGTGTCAVSCPDANANSDWGGDHHGIDVFAHQRAPMVAVADGTIVAVGVVSDTSGIRVRLRDSCGWEYYYGHLDQAVVSQGQTVTAGQLIGYMGRTGTGSTHLHFNISADGNYSSDINPFDLLQRTSGTACGGGVGSGGGGGGSGSGGGDPSVAVSCVDNDRILKQDGSIGDCSVYGSACVDDELGPRCALVFCDTVGPDTGCHPFGDEVLHCMDGALIDRTTCSANQHCVDDGAGARCVGFGGGGSPDAGASGGAPAETVPPACSASPLAGSGGSFFGAAGIVLALVLSRRRRRRLG